MRKLILLLLALAFVFSATIEKAGTEGKLSFSVSAVSDAGVVQPEVAKRIVKALGELGYNVDDDAPMIMKGVLSITKEKEISGISPKTMVSFQLDVLIIDSKLDEVLGSFTFEGSAVASNRDQAVKKAVREMRIDTNEIASTLADIHERKERLALELLEEGKRLIEEESYREALTKLKGVHSDSEYFPEAQRMMQDIRWIMPKPSIVIPGFRTNSRELSEKFRDILITTLVRNSGISEDAIILGWRETIETLPINEFGQEDISEMYDVGDYAGITHADFALVGKILASDDEIEVNINLLATDTGQIVMAFRKDGLRYQLEEIAREIAKEIQDTIDSGKMDKKRNTKEGMEGMPRIMLMISEEGATRLTPDPVSETEMYQRFVSEGFKVVDQTYIRPLRQTRAARAAIDGDTQSAIRIGEQYGAEVVIVGKVILAQQDAVQANALAIDRGTNLALSTDVHANTANVADPMMAAGRLLADEMIEPIVAGWPKDQDGVTPGTTSLLLPLNRVSESNNLDYDRQDRIDWWKIDLPVNGSLTIVVDSMPDSILILGLYGKDGKGQVAEPMDGERIYLEEAPANTYCLKLCVDQPSDAVSYTVDTLYTDARFDKGFRKYREYEYNECIKHLQKALETRYASENNLLTAHLYLGNSYIAKGERAKAVQQFRDLLEIDPDYEMDPVEYPPKTIAAFEEAKR